MNSGFFILLFINIDQGAKFVVCGNSPNCRSIKHWSSHNLTACGQGISANRSNRSKQHVTALLDFFTILPFCKKRAGQSYFIFSRRNVSFNGMMTECYGSLYFRKREESMHLPCWLSVNEEFVKLRKAEGGSLKKGEDEKRTRFSNRCDSMCLYNHKILRERFLFERFVLFRFFRPRCTLFFFLTCLLQARIYVVKLECVVKFLN